MGRSPGRVIGEHTRYQEYTNSGSRRTRVPHDVFLCHSSHDARVAESVCRALETAHMSCWMAPRDPIPGIPYAGQLVAAIGDARLLVVLLSAQANASQHVLRELELASTRQKTWRSIGRRACPTTEGV
jgi:hypothetical protein